MDRFLCLFSSLYLCHCNDSMISGSIVASSSRVFSSSAIVSLFYGVLIFFLRIFVFHSEKTNGVCYTTVGLHDLMHINVCLLIFSPIENYCAFCSLYVEICSSIIASLHAHVIIPIYDVIPFNFLQFEVNDELIPFFLFIQFVIIAELIS